MTKKPRYRTFNTASLIWGLFFILISSIGLYSGLGRSIDWKILSIGAPIALIVLGGISLLLNKPNNE